jgi:hypothetical protein
MNPTLYKHKNNTDVAFELLDKVFIKKIPLNESVYKLNVIWWNIGYCHEPWCMNIDQEIEIKIDKWKDWQLYSIS